ncbi:unnamed protein product [Leptosia nina]|uniref:FLYWCH-type domain-containing protein n=1 Tax=Leptosia nina TaxID=320188 RepID=A0AAV1J5R3_9NEOP
MGTRFHGSESVRADGFVQHQGTAGLTLSYLSRESFCKRWKSTIISSRGFLFIDRGNGRKTLMYNNYSYYRKYASLNSERWCCTLSGSCRAYIKFFKNRNETYFITLKTGKRQMYYDGNTYFDSKKGNAARRWLCTHYPKCKAFIRLDDDLVVLRKSDAHPHNHAKPRLCFLPIWVSIYLSFAMQAAWVKPQPPGGYSWSSHKHSNIVIVLKGTKPVELIVTTKGKRYLKFRDHYYVSHTGAVGRWRCIATNRCYASLYVDEHMRPLKITREHVHEPAVFVKTRAGYTRLNRPRNAYFAYRKAGMPELCDDKPPANVHFAQPMYVQQKANRFGNVSSS